MSSDNPEGLSFVELEHRYAWASKKPTFIFMTQDDAPWPRKFMETGEPARRVERFRIEVKDRVMVSFFSTPEDLSERWRPPFRGGNSHLHQKTRSSDRDTVSTSGIPATVDQFELAWRLVVDYKADPPLLRHMDTDHVKEALEKWAHDNVNPDRAPSASFEVALEQLRQKQTGPAPHPLWLAWKHATRTELEPNREPAQHG